MKPSEFYEKHWKIDYGKGLESPPKLTDIEKEFLDYSIENTNNTHAILSRVRGRTLHLDLNDLRNKIKQLK